MVLPAPSQMPTEISLSCEIKKLCAVRSMTWRISRQIRCSECQVVDRVRGSMGVFPSFRPVVASSGINQCLLVIGIPVFRASDFEFGIEPETRDSKLSLQHIADRFNDACLQGMMNSFRF